MIEDGRFVVAWDDVEREDDHSALRQLPRGRPEESQWRKLEVVAEVADRVRGRE